MTEILLAVSASDSGTGRAGDGRARSDAACSSAVALRAHLDMARKITESRTRELRARRETTEQTLGELIRLTETLAELVASLPRSSLAGTRRPRRSTETRAEDLETLHTRYAHTPDHALRARLVAAYDDFACAIARSFSTRRESRDDLIQVARLALVLALDRFDPHRGRPFKAFAAPTITGELKRHVRDRSWHVHVPRATQDHFLSAVRAVDDLTQTLGRSPRIPEVANETGLTEEQVLEGMEVGDCQRPSSFNAVPPGLDVNSEPASEEKGFESVEENDLLSCLISKLPPKEREIVHLRFVDELTQAEIATRVGGSQMSVSRTLTRALRRLRSLARPSDATPGDTSRCSLSA